MSRRPAVLGVLLAVALGAVTACGSGQPSSSTSSTTASPTPTGPKTAPADYVAVTDHVDETLAGSDASDKHNFVIGPKFTLEVQSIGTLAEISDTDADDLGLPNALKPAQGHEFLVTMFSSYTSYSQTVVDGGKLPGGEAGATKDPDEAVVVDGEVHKLTQPVDASGMLIVSVRPGHKAYLRFTQGGRSQSVDLRTGQRVKDSLTPYYPNQDMDPGHYPDYWDGAAFPVGVRMTLMSVDGTLSPFAPSAAWADKGKAWIYVRVISYSYCSENAPNCRVKLPRRDFSLVLPGGRMVHPKAGQKSMTSAGKSDGFDPTHPFSFGTGVFGFEVPAKTRKVTLVVSFAGRVTLIKGKRKVHVSMGKVPGPARVKLTA